MADKKKNVLAGITGAIRGYGKSMADRTNIMAQLAANQIELKDNWLYKMQEQQMKSQQVQQAYQGGAKEQGYEMGYGKEGNPELTAPSQEIYKRKVYEGILAKEAKGGKLDKHDQEFKDSYEGIRRKSSSATDSDTDAYNRWVGEIGADGELGADMESFDASEYQDGTILEDEEGKRYQVTNGQLQPLS